MKDYRLNQARDLWLYNGIVSAGFRLVDGSIELDTSSVITKKELFMQYAPQFNFELNADELVKTGVERGFLSKFDKERYLINSNY